MKIIAAIIIVTAMAYAEECCFYYGNYGRRCYEMTVGEICNRDTMAVAGVKLKAKQVTKKQEVVKETPKYERPEMDPAEAQILYWIKETKSQPNSMSTLD